MSAACFFDPDLKIGLQYRTWKERGVVPHQDPYTAYELRNKALRFEIRGSDLEQASATVKWFLFKGRRWYLSFLVV